MSKSQIMQIVQIPAEDIGYVAKVLGHTSPKVLDDWGKRASEERLIMVAAKLCDEFVGSVNLILDGADEQIVVDEVGKAPMINALSVLPAFRRRGVASSLIEAAEKLAGAYGDVVILGVGVDNYAARRLYEKLGYRPQQVNGEHTFVSTWPDIDELGNERMDSEECVLMVKVL